MHAIRIHMKEAQIVWLGDGLYVERMKEDAVSSTSVVLVAKLKLGGRTETSTQKFWDGLSYCQPWEWFMIGD